MGWPQDGSAIAGQSSGLNQLGVAKLKMWNVRLPAFSSNTFDLQFLNTRLAEKTVRVVMKQYHRKNTRRCAHCGRRFIIDPRVGNRHRFCSKKECDKASRTAARKKWLSKNGGKSYFSRAITLHRVREWRRAHPNYWKKTQKIRRMPSLADHDAKKIFEVLKSVGLQDTIDSDLALTIGIVSHITGSALQDKIAKELNRLILHGYAILRGKSREI